MTVNVTASKCGPVNRAIRFAPATSYISPRRAPQAKPAPSAIDALVEAPIQSRGLTMRIAAVPAPLATKPGATVAVGIELLAADAARAGSIDFTLVAVDSNGKVSHPAAIPEHFPGEGSTRPPDGRVSGRGSTCLRADTKSAWRRSVRNGTGGSVFTEVTVPKFTERPGDRRAVARVAGAAHRASGPSCSRGVLPLVPLAIREFPAATQLVAQLPIRATANGEAAINIETRLLRNDRDPMVLPAPAAAQVGFTGPGGAVYQVPLPPNLDAGAYRLIVEVASGRDRATRERVVQSAAEALIGVTLSTPRAAAAPAPAGRRDTRCGR